MYLSDEQMSAAIGAGVSAWAEVERPVGPQPLPSWVRGANVRWDNGAANAPSVILKTTGDVRQWDDKRWAKEDAKTYIARHPDGRAAVLYHDGPVSKAAAWRVFVGDKPFTHTWTVPDRRNGESWETAAQRAGDEHLAKCRRIDELYSEEKPAKEYRIVVKLLEITTLQGGFGGDGYLLAMQDGTERMLRGPWHGGAPQGYVEVSGYDSTSDATGWERSRKWYRRGGYAGLYITEDLFLRIMARYCPHVPIMRVEHSYGSRLEPYRVEWGAPKYDIYELEISRAQRKEPAGEFWRVYWDGREVYCGTLRIPEYGFRPEVTDLPTEAEREIASRRQW